MERLDFLEFVSGNLKRAPTTQGSGNPFELKFMKTFPHLIISVPVCNY